jgi:hypothetical protein
MDNRKIKREIVAIFMESPFYFTIPLQRRLHFVKNFLQKPVANSLRNFERREEGGD